MNRLSFITTVAIAIAVATVSAARIQHERTQRAAIASFHRYESKKDESA